MLRVSARVRVMVSFKFRFGDRDRFQRRIVVGAGCR